MIVCLVSVAYDGDAESVAGIAAGGREAAAAFAREGETYHHRLILHSVLMTWHAQLYVGELTEDPAALATYFYDLPSTNARRNSYIYPDPSNPSSLRIFNLVEEYSKAGFSLSAGAFAAPRESLILVWNVC